MKNQSAERIDDKAREMEIGPWENEPSDLNDIMEKKREGAVADSREKVVHLGLVQSDEKRGEEHQKYLAKHPELWLSGW